MLISCKATIPPQVSERYAVPLGYKPIESKHFLQYGFPLMCLCIAFTTLYQYVVFSLIL